MNINQAVAISILVSAAPLIFMGIVVTILLVTHKKRQAKKDEGSKND